MYKAISRDEYLALEPSYDPGSFLDTAERRELEDFLEIDLHRKTIRDLTAKFVQSVEGRKPAFLDIGCGMGAYLLAAQREGYEALGFEPSKDHAHVATALLDLPVVSDYFSPSRVEGRKFDLIMLSHVIEHIYDPKEFLRGAISVLKPGGALIVVTPNTDSLVAHATGANWPMLAPVDHVTLISPRSYAHLEFDDVATVSHWCTEHPYEFAAAFAAIVKSKLRSSPGGSVADTTPTSHAPVLRRRDAKTAIMRAMLTIASVPAFALATSTRKQACLNTAIIRR